MKLTQKSKTFIRYLAGPLLFILLAFVIWKELTSKNQLPLLIQEMNAAFLSERVRYLLLLIVLMPINWLLEAFKWKVALRSIVSISLFTSFRATLSGLSFSMLLPNRVGEYLGRIVYLPSNKRADAVAVTIVSSMSQLIWTLVFGLLGFIYLFPLLRRATQLGDLLLVFFGIGVLLFLLFLLIFYFRISQIALYLANLFQSERLRNWLMGPTRFDVRTLLLLLGISLLRYCIFLMQYGFALYLFSVLLNPYQLFATVSLCFLILTSVPNFAIAELGMRGVVGIWIIGFYSTNSAGILLAAFSLWVVNLVLPAALGALFLLGVEKYWRNE